MDLTLRTTELLGKLKQEDWIGKRDEGTITEPLRYPVLCFSLIYTTI
jgi:hypothetical protein